ncbi:Thiopurine S-methyltransferase (TPMT) [Nocardioides szechwanensis]|uniref:Thiopurine S-methyltransferase (TPMT) n=1 Tax=Nocardioides szechwanensis TaxID=1005944 RepID=A0A1H0A0T4_9ACTN|nr:class I SAM-dependent methyltransferase [Nocardioides szechwanensis]SDN27200.1 Thiopurine S-methyltransferase (TPMT) [Nocardioides szechwanensis]
MSHEHHEVDLATMYTQETWDARYAESERVWSGNPNPRLVEQVAGLTPGRALDVGCGEGADVVWLAQQGWAATGVDVSEVALLKAAAHAEEAGVEDKVLWERLDLIGGDELPGDQDLVSVQFFHPPPAIFAEIHERIGAAVRPGGHLLVVGHHPDDVTTGVRRPHGPDLLFTPERVVAALDPAAWEVLVAETPTREHQHGDGPATVTDTVVLARKR